MRQALLESKIEIPKGTEIHIDTSKLIKAKGHKGENTLRLLSPKVRIEKKDNFIIVFSKNATRREKKMINSFAAHIKNLIKGVNEGYVYKLKLCASHFPMTIAVEGDQFVIRNFIGEKIPRKANILEGVKVKIQADIITVEGIDLEKTSQTAANIEKSTRRPGFDKRVFQDGIYITEKAGVPIK